MPGNVMRHKKLHETLMEIGALLGCHQMPERSFFIKGYQFPLCARCTGLLLGYLFGTLLWVVEKMSIPICIIMCGFMYMDWKLQDLHVLPSTNIRRLVTGLMCGIGYIHIIARIIDVLLNLLMKVWR